MEPVAFIEIYLPDIEPQQDFAKHTTLLSSPHYFRTHIVLGFLPGIKKGPELQGIFNDVLPINDTWTLELAVELPDLLPSIDRFSETAIPVRTRQGNDLQICLSNRMSRFHFDNNNVAHQILAPRYLPWHGHVQVTNDCGDKTLAAEELLRTVAAMRFKISGNSTEHAFESCIKHCTNTLFDAINTTLHAVRACRHGSFPGTRSVSDRNVPFVYVLIEGANKKRSTILAMSPSRITIHPDYLNDERADRFRALMNGSIIMDDADRILGEARSSWANGDDEFALLQTVIAAEMATSRTIRTACRRKGISEKRLKDAERDMSYSWALNIGLAFVLDPADMPAAELIAAMNTARTKRNKLMHEATLHANRKEILQLLNDTHDFLAALKQAVK